MINGEVSLRVGISLVTSRLSLHEDPSTSRYTVIMKYVKYLQQIGLTFFLVALRSSWHIILALHMAYYILGIFS